MASDKKPRRKTFVKMCDLTEEQRERRRSINRKASRNFKRRLQEHEQQQERELLDLTYQNSCLRGDIEKIKEEIRRLQHWLSCHPCIRPQGGAIGSNTHGEGLGENTVLISNSNEEELVGVLGGYETYNLTSIWQHGAGEEGTSSCIKPNLGAPYSITLNPTWSPVPCVGTSTAETAVDWETLSSCMFQGQSDQ